MPDFHDTPTEEGATNVVLNQREATAPFAREVVNIQGDENAGRAIGFDAEGRLACLVIYEDPFATVDTEAEFDAALAAGRSIQLGGGTIDLTTVKHITTPRTVIQGPGHLRFVGLAGAGITTVRCLCLATNDITLQDFELSSDATTFTTSLLSGINFPANTVAHRATIRHLDIHHWHACIDRHGDVTTDWVDDITIEDCYLHTFHGWGMYMAGSFRRTMVRRCRILGKQTSETHDQGVANAIAFYGRLEDVLAEDCTCGHVLGMGIEINAFLVGGTNVRPKVVRCRVVDVGYFGVSFGHSVQGYGENILVDGAKGIGIEVAGNENLGRCSDSVLVACDVRNITTHNTLNYTTGYAVTGTSDTALDGCRATNVSATNPNESNGVYVANSDRAAIRDCAFRDVGANGVHLYYGDESLNTEGHHLVQGCTFRHTFNMPGSVDPAPFWCQRSIYVSNTNAVVRLNTTYQRVGGDMRYTSACTTGAATYCDQGAPVGAADFTGSNNVIPVPAV